GPPCEDGSGPSSYAGAVARASPLWRGGRAGKPGGSGRLVLLAGLGERADQVDDVADLAQAHAVAVQEVLQDELALQGVAVVAQLLDQGGDDGSVGALQDRQGQAAGLRQVGE